ncbi:MAG: DUF5625 family protein [Smithellaceae bacterium]
MKRILAAIITILVCFTACEAAAPKPPIKFPFSVHKEGATVTTEMQVKKAHHYWFELTFLHNKADDEAERERLRKLVGSWEKNKDGESREPGIQIPLKITVSVMDSSGVRNVYEKELLVGSVWSGGVGGWSRAIGAIEIPAGQCRITVQSMKDIPELSNREVVLEIRYSMQAKY